MGVSYRDIVYIVVILFYVPSFLIAIFLSIRYGWRRGGIIWFTLVIFTLSRIIGASLHLATISHPNNIRLYIGAGSLAVDGLSPLLFSALAIIHRIRTFNKAPEVFNIGRLLRLIELALTAAFILISIGYARLSAADVRYGIDSHDPTAIAAAFLFSISFAGIVLATLLVIFPMSRFASSERQILFVLVISIPFLLVRTIYLDLDILANNQRFSPIRGDVTIFLLCALFEEAVVVAMYEITGIRLPILSKYEAENVALDDRGRENDAYSSDNDARWLTNGSVPNSSSAQNASRGYGGSNDTRGGHGDLR